MTRNYIFSFLLTLMVAMGLTAQAEQWVQHPNFSGGTATKNIIDTEHRVFYVVGTNLFCYDKATEQSQVLNTNNLLHDANVTQIYYNNEQNYVVVTYLNSNIDIIKADLTVVNVPAIKDVVMNRSKLINDVTFSGGNMYVATDFGFVKFDEKTFDYKMLRNFNTTVTSVAQVGEYIVLGAGNKIYYDNAQNPGDVLVYYSTYSKAYANPHFYPINDTNFLVTATAGLYRMAIGIDEQTGQATLTPTTIFTGSALVAGPVQKRPGGFLVNYFSKSFYYTLNEQGAAPAKVSGGKEMYSAWPAGDGTLWGIGASGLHIKGETTYDKPNSPAFADVLPYWLTYSPLEKKIYVTNSGPWKGASSHTSHINTYDGKQWQNVTPSFIPNGGLYPIAFHPTDTNTYFIPAWKGDYLYRITNGAKVASFRNSWPLSASSYGPRMAFDDYGNLWMVQEYPVIAKPVAVLPFSALDKENLAKTDWLTFAVEDAVAGQSPQRNSIAVSKGSNVKVYCGGDFKRPIVFWKEEGELKSGVTLKSKAYTSFADIDGGMASWTYTYRIKADSLGQVWVAAMEGLFAFDPAKAFDDDFRVNNCAAMNGSKVYSMTFDPQGNVWVATEDMGLCQISGDGKTLLKQYNIDNSPIPHNTVYDVCYAPMTNSIFMTTELGLMELKFDTQLGSDNFDNVYASPALVLPDFTGHVTIYGLMDGATVLIKDVDGNVVKQLDSTAGIAKWDCCDDAGERLPTGKYLVYAAIGQPADDAAPVTFINIVK